MPNPDIPHFAVPINFTRVDYATVQADLVEQDSYDEIVQCIFACVAYGIEQREDEPEFGITEQALTENGADLDEIEYVVSYWEPRADVVLTDDISKLADMVETVQVDTRSVTSG